MLVIILTRYFQAFYFFSFVLFLPIWAQICSWSKQKSIFSKLDDFHYHRKRIVFMRSILFITSGSIFIYQFSTYFLIGANNSKICKHYTKKNRTMVPKQMHLLACRVVYENLKNSFSIWCKKKFQSQIKDDLQVSMHNL